MDFLAHALYGGTVCSRSGLAGGRKGAPGRGFRSLVRDRSLWFALLFGVLPDAVSMWPSFLLFWFEGAQGNFFAGFDGPGLVVYHYVHSLLVALAAAGLLRLIWKPLFVPSLAWSLHLVMDAVTHGSGKFQTMLFYPLSSFHIEGIRWWRHRGVVLTYWALLPAIWLALWVWRRGGRTRPSPSPTLGKPISRRRK